MHRDRLDFQSDHAKHPGLSASRETGFLLHGETEPGTRGRTARYARSSADTPSVVGGWGRQKSVLPSDALTCEPPLALVHNFLFLLPPPPTCCLNGESIGTVALASQEGSRSPASPPLPPSPAPSTQKCRRPKEGVPQMRAVLTVLTIRRMKAGKGGEGGVSP